MQPGPEFRTAVYGREKKQQESTKHKERNPKEETELPDGSIQVVGGWKGGWTGKPKYLYARTCRKHDG